MLKKIALAATIALIGATVLSSGNAEAGYKGYGSHGHFVGFKKHDFGHGYGHGHRQYGYGHGYSRKKHYGYGFKHVKPYFWSHTWRSRR